MESSVSLQIDELECLSHLLLSVLDHLESVGVHHCVVVVCDQDGARALVLIEPCWFVAIGWGHQAKGQILMSTFHLHQFPVQIVQIIIIFQIEGDPNR